MDGWIDKKCLTSVVVVATFCLHSLEERKDKELGGRKRNETTIGKQWS